MINDTRRRPSAIAKYLLSVACNPVLFRLPGIRVISKTSTDYSRLPHILCRGMETENTLSPRESGKFISKQAQHVSLNDDGIKNLARKIFEKIMDQTINIDMFSQHELHPSFNDPSAIDWLFVVDTLNFCFWSPNLSHWVVSYGGKQYSGYYALCAALRRAQDDGFAITDPKCYSKITVEDLLHLLRGDEGSAVVPLIHERVKCLHEVGNVLLSKYEGTFRNCVQSCNGSAEALLQIIVSDFPNFRDQAVYQGQSVSFYKRAQILVGDIWACFKGEGLGYFKDIDIITMFPDYRVPQVLVHFGVLKYSSELQKRLLSNEIFESGCPEEAEIRGCSIHAVELVCIQTQTLLSKVTTAPSCHVNSILIDYFLWEFRRKYANELAEIPFHKVVSMFY